MYRYSTKNKWWGTTNYLDKFKHDSLSSCNFPNISAVNIMELDNESYAGKV